MDPCFPSSQVGTAPRPRPALPAAVSDAVNVSRKEGEEGMAGRKERKGWQEGSSLRDTVIRWLHSVWVWLEFRPGFFS